MNPAVAYRAIIRYLAGHEEEYAAIVSEAVEEQQNSLVDVIYYYNKYESVEAKLDTMSGYLHIDGTVKKWSKGCI